MKFKRKAKNAENSGAKKTAENEKRFSAAKKKIFVTVLGCAVIMCAFIGIGKNLPETGAYRTGNSVRLA